MLFLAPLFWATRNVTGKLGKAWLSPYAFTFWRWLLATALLSLLFRRQIRADWPQLKARAGWLFVVGGSGFALFNVVLYGAFARGASVVNVSMITALIPLAVLLVDVGFLRGRAHPLQWLGVALSFVGVLWLVSRGEPRGADDEPATGVRRAVMCWSRWRWSRRGLGFRNGAPCVWHSGGGRNRMRAFS